MAPHGMPEIHPFLKLSELASAAEVIWARVRGYPSWPAQVLSDAAARKKLGKVSHKKEVDIPVMFFGTLEIAWIGKADVVSFADGIHKGFITKGKQKSFQKALEQVQEFLAVDGKRKAPQQWWCKPPSMIHGQDDGNGMPADEACKVPMQQGDTIRPFPKVSDYAGCHESITPAAPPVRHDLDSMECERTGNEPEPSAFQLSNSKAQQQQHQQQGTSSGNNAGDQRGTTAATSNDVVPDKLMDSSGSTMTQPPAALAQESYFNAGMAPDDCALCAQQQGAAAAGPCTLQEAGDRNASGASTTSQVDLKEMQGGAEAGRGQQAVVDGEAGGSTDVQQSLVDMPSCAGHDRSQSDMLNQDGQHSDGWRDLESIAIPAQHHQSNMHDENQPGSMGSMAYGASMQEPVPAEQPGADLHSEGEGEDLHSEGEGEDVAPTVQERRCGVSQFADAPQAKPLSKQAIRAEKLERKRLRERERREAERNLRLHRSAGVEGIAAVPGAGLVSQACNIDDCVDETGQHGHDISEHVFIGEDAEGYGSAVLSCSEQQVWLVTPVHCVSPMPDSVAKVPPCVFTQQSPVRQHQAHGVPYSKQQHQPQQDAFPCRELRHGSFGMLEECAADDRAQVSRPSGSMAIGAGSRSDSLYKESADDRQATAAQAAEVLQLMCSGRTQPKQATSHAINDGALPSSAAEVVRQRPGRILPGFVWPEGEVLLPEQQEAFMPPGEWLSVRPPQYELVKRNTWGARRRPNKLHKEEISVCCCRPPALDFDEYGRPIYGGGCTHGCLNRMSFIHCDPRSCPCGELCSNKPFHLLKSPKIQTILTENRGHGIRAMQFLSRGAFIIEYCGEVVDAKELEARMMEARSIGEQHFYIMELGPGLFIDARHKGNMARLLNSSCDPNCETQKWHDAATGEARVGVFARRDIAPGEELTYDYFFQHYGSNAQSVASFQCMCGAKNCRGTMDINPEKRKDLGRRLEVQWDGDGTYYSATVIGFNPSTRKHFLLYDEGGNTERLCLANVPHRWLCEDAAQPSPGVRPAAAATMVDQDTAEQGGAAPQPVSAAGPLGQAALTGPRRSDARLPLKKRARTWRLLSTAQVLQQAVEPGSASSSPAATTDAAPAPPPGPAAAAGAAVQANGKGNLEVSSLQAVQAGQEPSDEPDQETYCLRSSSPDSAPSGQQEAAPQQQLSGSCRPLQPPHSASSEDDMQSSGLVRPVAQCESKPALRESCQDGQAVSAQIAAAGPPCAAKVLGNDSSGAVACEDKVGCEGMKQEHQKHSPNCMPAAPASRQQAAAPRLDDILGISVPPCAVPLFHTPSQAAPQAAPVPSQRQQMQQAHDMSKHAEQVVQQQSQQGHQQQQQVLSHDMAVHAWQVQQQQMQQQLLHGMAMQAAYIQQQQGQQQQQQQLAHGMAMQAMQLLQQQQLAAGAAMHAANMQAKAAYGADAASWNGQYMGHPGWAMPGTAGAGAVQMPVSMAQGPAGHPGAMMGYGAPAPGWPYSNAAQAGGIPGTMGMVLNSSVLAGMPASQMSTMSLCKAVHGP